MYDARVVVVEAAEGEDAAPAALALTVVRENHSRLIRMYFQS